VYGCTFDLARRRRTGCGCVARSLGDERRAAAMEASAAKAKAKAEAKEPKAACRACQRQHVAHTCGNPKRTPGPKPSEKWTLAQGCHACHGR